MNELITIQNQLVPVGSFDAYLARVNQIPMLSLEEEQELAKELQENGNIQAAQKLVLSHLRYVAKVAKGYMGYGLALNDLVQEGTVGLMKAVKRFEPEKGVRLVSFAIHWIKAEIHEFVLKNWRIVKVATTKAQRKLFFKLRSAKKAMNWLSLQEATDVAQDLGVGIEEVFRMEARLHASDTTFDLPSIESEEKKALPAPCEYLEAPNSNPLALLATQGWAAKAQEKLYMALEKIDERSSDILEKRWLTDDKATLHDLAATYGVSAERIRQLEKNAIEKLKEQMLDLEINP